MKGLPRVNGEHREISMRHQDKLMDSVLRFSSATGQQSLFTVSMTGVRQLHGKPVFGFTTSF